MNSIFVDLVTYRSFFRTSEATVELVPGGITALVGPNNSGKSSVLRFFHELKNPLVNVGSGGWHTPSADEATSERETPWNTPESTDVHELVPKPLLESDLRLAFRVRLGGSTLDFELRGQQLRQHEKRIRSDKSLHRPDGIGEVGSAVSRLGNSIYLGPYRNISTKTSSGGAQHYGMPVGDQFVASWHAMKNGGDALQRKAAIRAQTEIASLLGYNSVDINPTSDNTSLVLVFDGKESFHLGEIGAGIAQLIFSLITAAVRKPDLILIDEPELHLHPGMQARFLEVLSKYAQLSTICATHSIGLARQVADKVLVVTQDRNTGISSIRPLEGVKDYGQLLGEMGYSQYAALGGKRLLLVEGTTEVKTMRMWLRQLKVDADVMIVPLGGSSLIGPNRSAELEEFQRVGADVYVIIDSERNSTGESISDGRGQFLQDCQRLFGPDRVIATDRRATENYFTDRAIKTVLGEKYQVLGHYEKISDASQGWGKERNWQIADAMSIHDIADTDLGGFLIALSKTGGLQAKT